MPTNQIRVNPPSANRSDGDLADALGGKQGEQILSELHGRYYIQGYRGNLFIAHAIVTAPVIYSTAAGTGGPFVWNPPSSGINVELLAAGFGTTVVTTVAAALGITGASGQVAVPTATTAIDSSTNCKLGGAASRSTAYRVATPVNAGTFFFPFAQVHTGALTADTTGIQWVDLGGFLIVPPGSWASIAASATATTLVAQIGLLFGEVPV